MVSQVLKASTMLSIDQNDDNSLPRVKVQGEKPMPPAPYSPSACVLPAQLAAAAFGGCGSGGRRGKRDMTFYLEMSHNTCFWF